MESNDSVTENDLFEIAKFKEQDEMLRKILELLTKDRINALKECIKNKTQKEFVFPLKRSNKEIINRLYNINTGLPKETINLLNQSYMTIQNVHKLIKNKSLVDSNVLLRSAFENLVMGMMIYFDNNVYNEFKKLGLKDNVGCIKIFGIEIRSNGFLKASRRKNDTREYTRIQRLINSFKSKLKIIDEDFFTEMSNRKIRDLLNEYYDKLCQFTHSTLVVNQMVEAVLNGDEDFFLIIVKQNIYFLEILLNLCLKYIIKDKNSSIKYEYVFIGWLIIINDIDKEKYTPEYLSKYNMLLYEDINKDYINNSKNDIKTLQDEMKKIEKIIWENPVAVIELLESFLTEEEKKTIEIDLQRRSN